MIQIYLGQPSLSSTLELSASLSQYELDKANRFRFEGDRELYLFTHGMKRQVLAKTLQCEAAAIEFKIDKFGKPWIVTPNIPNLNFNISHTPGLAAIAISTGAELIGVDVEFRRDNLDIDELSNQVFSEDEKRVLLNFETGSKRLEFFYRIWTLKEAYLKGIGMGLSMPPQTLSFALSGQSSNRIELTPKAELDAGWEFLNFAWSKQHAVSVAIQAGLKSVDSINIFCQGDNNRAMLDAGAILCSSNDYAQQVAVRVWTLRP